MYYTDKEGALWQASVFGGGRKASENHLFSIIRELPIFVPSVTRYSGPHLRKCS